MSERIYERTLVNIEAELISCNVTYPAFINDISEYGIHAKVAHAEASLNLKPDTNVDLKLTLPTGKILYLNCKKIWSRKNTSKSYIEYVGAEIIDPPMEYTKLYREVSHHVFIR